MPLTPGESQFEEDPRRRRLFVLLAILWMVALALGANILTTYKVSAGAMGTSQPLPDASSGGRGVGSRSLLGWRSNRVEPT